MLDFYDLYGWFQEICKKNLDRYVIGKLYGRQNKKIEETGDKLENGICYQLKYCKFM